MIPSLALACLLLLCQQNDAAPATEHRVTMTKMSKEDLDGSATGYVYNQQQGLPVYYVRYTNHGSGRYYHQPDAVQYVAGVDAPVAHVAPNTTPLLLSYATAEDVPHQGTGNYGNEQSLGRVVVPVNSVPRAPYYVETKIARDEDEGKEETYENGVGEDQDDEDCEEDGDGGDEEEDHCCEDAGGNIHGGSVGSVGEWLPPYPGGYDNEGIEGKSHADGGSTFEAGKGAKHAAEEYSEHGQKGEKGYSTEEMFGRGESGSNDDEHQESEFTKH